MVLRTLLAHLRRAALGIVALVALHGASLAAESKPPVILIVGDSISAGYGLPAGTGWTRLLQQRLAEQSYPHRVINASISGDTTAGGRARLPGLLADRPAITVIELGGNDGLRGGNVDAMTRNLDAMAVAAQEAGSRVLIIGMRLPPNYGPDYLKRFESSFAEVAARHKTALVPFFFEGFGDDSEMFQPDRIHPVAAAQARLLDNVWGPLKPLLGPPAKGR
jgi:acyl-CoA thioesterase I